MARKNYSFGFVIDPLEGFNPQAETTLFLMAEAQRRGHQIFAFTLPDLSYHSGSLFGHSIEIEILGINRVPFYKILQKKKIDLASLDALFLRKDPPFDLPYLHHLYLLEQIRDKVFMLNDPLGILKASEKIFPLQFSHLMPKTCITRHFDDLLDFSKDKKHGVILKPIQSSGGRGVFYLKPHDSNLKVAFEVLSKEGAEYILAQEFLPEVLRGDKRIVLLDGDILGFFLRVPQKGEHRANLHSGGRLKKCSITSKERAITREIAPALREAGLYFVGLDLIGERLTEVNVTSPMGIREMNETMGIRSEVKVIDFVEGKIKR
jgi:glutathione synthase